MMMQLEDIKYRTEHFANKLYSVRMVYYSGELALAEAKTLFVPG
jgi:hypothetical protein